MNSRITTHGINDKGRDFAVGDIHGCFSKLERALETVGFAPKVDRLFSVGDLVDRGPESLQVLDWLDKPWFHAICGNHDFMAWRTALYEPCPIDHLKHGGDWLQTVHEPLRRQLGLRLAALPLAMEVATPQGAIGLVHADCPFDDWDNMFDAPLPGAAMSDCLWSIARYQQQNTRIVEGVRAVVHGHVTIPEMKVLGNTYFIDTGGGDPAGRFTLLNLHSLEATTGPGPVFRIPPNPYYR